MPNNYLRIIKNCQSYYDKIRTYFISNYGLPVFLLVLFSICMNIVSVYHNSPTYDEPGNIEFGRRILNRTVETASMQRMPILALNALPLLIVEISNAQLSAKDLLWFCRFPTIIAAASLSIFVFIWSKKLYGVEGGLFSLFLFVFCPNLVAHSRLATSDIYCSLFIFLSIFYFIKYLNHQSWWRVIIVSFVLGIAQISKQTALLLFPVFCLVLLVKNITIKKKIYDENECQTVFIPKTAIHCVVSVLIVGVIINCVYGFKFDFKSLDEHKVSLELNNPDGGSFIRKPISHYGISQISKLPIPLPTPYVEAFFLAQHYNFTGSGHGPIYLLGSLSKYGWWYYFPTAFLLKTPLPTLVFIICAFYFIIVKFKSRSLTPDEIIISFAVASIFSFFCFSCTAQIGIRYILPVMPLIYVLIGQIMVKTNRLSPNRFSKLALLISFWLIIYFFSYFPHYISYFNELCWDRNKHYRYLADSNLEWGQNDDYVREYIQLHRDQSLSINPKHPVKGIIIVNANDLVGINSEPETYNWLRENHEPVGNIAYSWIVYNIKEL